MKKSITKKNSLILGLVFIILLLVFGFLFRYLKDNMSQTVYFVIITIVVVLGGLLFNRLNSKSIGTLVLVAFLLVAFIEFIGAFLTVLSRFFDLI